MKKKLLFIMLALTGLSINAQNKKISYEVKKKNLSGAPTSIKFLAESDITHENFIEKMKDEFKFQADDKLEIIKTNKDKYGNTHYKYSQKYKDLIVFGAQYIIHEKNGKATSANGNFYSTLSLNTNPSIKKDEAITNAMKYCGLEKYRWQDTTCEEALKRKNKNSNATYYPKPVLTIAQEKGIFKLCWKFDIAGLSLSKAWTVFIDATDGHLVNKINKVTDGDFTGSVNTTYNGTKSITCFDNISVDGYYYLSEQETRGPTAKQVIQTVDAQTDTLPNWGNFANIVNTTSTWIGDPEANQVHWGVEKAYDFYYSNYTRNSFDDNGYYILNLVHYDVGMANAFWNGNDTVMCYGDGDGTSMYSVTGLDVAGHELTHAYTEYTSNLDYQGESGALNESFSDIFGVGVENFGIGSTAGLWTIGEDIMVTDPYLRSMSNPSASPGNQPDTYLGTLWAPTGLTDLDEGGVHTNSGVQNFWFYLLSVGGSGINDNGNNYSVTGIGIQNALDIAYQSETFYLTNTADYTDAMNGSIQATQDIFGASSPEEQSVNDAWCAVGVGLCNPSSVSNLISANNISISPNPSKGIITISSFFNSNNFDINIVNVLGEEIYKSQMFSKTMIIDLSNELNGIYFIKLKSENGTATKKIIINK